VIRTGYKQRIPGTWSFVVSAKGVSEALAGVPQFSKLALHFRHSRLVVQGWKTWERDPKAIDIGEVSFRCYSPTVGLGTEPHWTVEVEAVPREQKPRIALLVKNEGLALVRHWLEQRSALDVGDRNQGLRLSFNPREGTLCVA
jgi:hypothetical protein